jgi:hypothetical protein
MSYIRSKISGFEIVLLIVGIAVAVLGFHLINQAYTLDKGVTWMMVISIFNWLSLLVLFILLSITVDVSKNQLAELERLTQLITQKKGKK